MPIERLGYAELGERLGVSAEVARTLVKRHHLPRLRANNGKTLVAVDFEELHQKPLPARSARDHRLVIEAVAPLKARIAELEAALAEAQQQASGHQCERASRLIAAQDRPVGVSTLFVEATAVSQS